jgi:hypothetical protein
MGRNMLKIDDNGDVFISGEFQNDVLPGVDVSAVNEMASRILSDTSGFHCDVRNGVNSLISSISNKHGSVSLLEIMADIMAMQFMIEMKHAMDESTCIDVITREIFAQHKVGLAAALIQAVCSLTSEHGENAVVDADLGEKSQMAFDRLCLSATTRAVGNA